MTVSVVIPAFNADRYLGEAIQSVLAQTTAVGEVLVIDDGSADGTGEVARSFGDPVRWVWQARSGAGAARNRGADLARGDELAFLDADDLWAPSKLELQLPVLSSDRELGAVFGHVQGFHSPELSAWHRARLGPPGSAVAGICPGTMLLRREAFMQIGGFATRWTRGEFIDWYARAVDAHLRSVVLPDTIMHRRLHLANRGAVQHDPQTDYARVLRAILVRRRAGAP